jgi:hypothetical protein
MERDSPVCTAEVGIASSPRKPPPVPLHASTQLTLN